MTNVITAFMELVYEVDPHRSPESIPVTVVGCPTAVSDHGPHVHLTDISHALHPAADTRTVTLVQLSDCQVMTRSHEPDGYSVKDLITAVADPALSEAVGVLLHLRTFTPRENDPIQIMAKLDSVDDLSNLAHEYIKYEDDLLDELSQSSGPSDLPVGAEVLQSECRRIIADLEHIRMQTVGSSRARDLLAEAAGNVHGIARDENMVSVVISEPYGYNNPFDGQDKDRVRQREWTTALWLAITGSTDGLYTTSFIELPKWAYDLLTVIAPDMVRSAAYPVGTTPSDVLETARTLWNDGGTYAEFDNAYQAARTLHDC